MFNSSNGTLPVSIPLGVGNNGGFGGGNGFDDIIALAIVAMIFGWNNGGFFGGGQGAAQNYTLASDFATIQRQLSDGFNSIDNALDRQNAGICDLGYTQAQLINGVQINQMQNANAIQTQLADCCCKTQQNIKDTQYAIATTGAGIQSAIKDCCCDVEKQNMQTNYNMATQNCATLSAIDKLGDRIIGYMDAEKTAQLRDENFALKLASSQAQQNTFIQNLVRPQINPCYLTQNPYCSCGNANPLLYGYGTTIA